MEHIIDRLNKIKTLSERGIDGEAQAAQIALEKVLKRYNLTLDDLTDNLKKQRVFLARGRTDKAALFLCCLNLFGADRYRELRIYKGDPAKVYIALTDYEFAELSEFYEFHKRNIKKEFHKMVDDFLMAYQYKHKLYSSTKIENAREITFEEIMKIQMYANEIQDVSFYKALHE
jgi:hypothetical protein